MAAEYYDSFKPRPVTTMTLPGGRQRLLLGSGPANIAPEVSAVMTQDQILPVCPEMVKLQEEIKEHIRYVFKTKNTWTFAVSGSGHAAMECSLSSCLERGDRVLIASHGFWGWRAHKMAEAHGYRYRKIDAPLGEVFQLRGLEQNIREYCPDALFICHGESSTGVLQPLEGLGEICRRNRCLLIVDVVVSLGAAPFYMDDWKIDVAYSASQKSLGGPTGVSYVSFGDRAMQKISDRTTPIDSHYLNALTLGKYWGCSDDDSPVARYHHSPSSTLLLGCRESLIRVRNEGIESLWKRHGECSEIFRRGLADIGLEIMPKSKHQLPNLFMIRVPDGVDYQRVIDSMDSKYRVRIGGALATVWPKQIWRIGFMGYNADPEIVRLTLRLLAEIVKETREGKPETSAFEPCSRL